MPHWPAGATWPFVTSRHMPSAMPVNAIVHATQVPVHARLQQTLLAPLCTQCEFEHWLSVVQGCPSPSVLQCLVPSQTPLWQSAAVLHFFAFAQSLPAPQVAPQSTSDSLPFWNVS